jgi:hypothetical protein
MPSAEILVLAANQAFYETFVRADAGTMDALWARRAPVACIHPGWGALEGREEVMESWRAILDHGPPPIRCSGATAHVIGETAYVICRETIDDAELVATNFFVLEDGEWFIAHHQAGPVHRRADARARPVPSGMLN